MGDNPPAEDLWVFGYGSLIWRPDFDFVERRTAYLPGYRRRFWQGSTDHRGTPETPGRVVTLLAGNREDVCWGMAYRLAGDAARAVVAKLDHRERGGYSRRYETLIGTDGSRFSALVYVATERNPNYLGPAPLEAIAAQVAGAHGPSGANVDYVLELARALEALGVVDDHVRDLAALVNNALATKKIP